MSVAILIPLFNHERYIAEALRSVLAQTRMPDRIIVIDDGSSDASVEAARSVADPRVTLITQENSGAHSTLNRAVSLAADAEFIGILNSDDCYEPCRLEKCLQCLEARKNSDVLVTRLRLIDETSALLGQENPRVRWLDSVWRSRPPSLPAWAGIANFTKTTSNLFGRTAWFRAHPFRPYRYVHDYFFAITAVLEDRLTVLDEELLRYRVHTANTIKSGPGGELPREMIRMNLDLLREFAPALAASAEMRSRFAAYFRTLSLNFSDFRLEPFLHLVSIRIAALTDAEIEALCASVDPASFPEMLAGKSHAMRESLAQTSYENLLRSLASSRWLALGRLIGGAPCLVPNAATAEARLAALQNACAASAWFRLGEKLGLVKADAFLRNFPVETCGKG